MFKVYKLNDDKYLIFKEKRVEIEGTKAEIIRELLRMGVKEQEIFYGMDALEEDDIADYGINKTFIYSEKITKVMYSA